MALQTTPLNLLGYQQVRVARLEVAVGMLSLTVLLLVGVGAWAVWHGVPIHYIPPGGPGMSVPDHIPDAFATDFAVRCLKARYTFTPATVKLAHAEMAMCLHPTLSIAFQTQAEQEGKMIKDVQLSTQLAVVTATVTARTPEMVTVTLEARRTLWIGGQQVREEAVSATLVLVPWAAQGAATGLVVSRLQVTPPLQAARL